MNIDHFSEQAQSYLERLSVEIGERPVGSAGNRAATDFFAEAAKAAGFDVETAGFECIDWRQEGANLTLGGERFDVSPSPYSLGVETDAPLAAVESLEALGAADLQGKILLLHGPIAGEPLMPKDFPFYNPEEHQEIIRLLERGAPRAIVCATGRHSSMAGGMYPFPMIEDGDFDVPSVYMTDVEGERLLQHVGETATLESRAWRVAALALTSEHVEELTSEITHTAKDRPEIVSVEKLVETAEAVCDVVLAVDGA